jgi:hypothetical protein
LVGRKKQKVSDAMIALETRKEVLLLKLNQEVVLTSQEVEECLVSKDTELIHLLTLNPYTTPDTLDKIYVQMFEEESSLSWHTVYKKFMQTISLASHWNLSEKTKWAMLKNNESAYAICKSAILSDEMVSYALKNKKGKNELDEDLATNLNLNEKTYYKLYNKHSFTGFSLKRISLRNPEVLGNLSRNQNTPLEIAVNISKIGNAEKLETLAYNVHINELVTQINLFDIKDEVLLDVIESNYRLSSTALYNLFINRFNKSFSLYDKESEGIRTSSYFECLKILSKINRLKEKDIKAFIEMGLEFVKSEEDPENVMLSCFLNRQGNMYHVFKQYVLETYGLDITELTDDMIGQLLNVDK